jgi:hypothetical protein
MTEPVTASLTLRVRESLRPLTKALAALFVVWQVAFLLWDNIAQQWPGVRAVAAVTDSAFDRAAQAWGATLRMGQGWPMFRPPMWRVSPFPAVRIVFDDGSTETVASDNEPPDPARFLRLGGHRERRRESYLLDRAESLTFASDRDLWSAHVARALADWRAERTGDRRTVERVELVAREYALPPPGSPSAGLGPPRERVVAEFGPEGEPLP